MKTLFTLTTVLSLFLLTQSSCLAQRKIKGNGNITTKTLSTPEYDAVKVVGFMDVYLESGKEGTITVSTDDNLHEYIKIEVNQGELSIRIKKGVNLRTKKGIAITVPVENIEKVSLVGSGDVETRTVLQSSQFDVSLVGSGDIQLDINTTQTDVKIVGSGDIRLTGTTTNLEVKLSGSGDFNGFSLLSENTEAYVSGSGDVKVMAKQQLKARVNGSGDIVYKGNPTTISSKVVGSGDITGY